MGEHRHYSSDRLEERQLNMLSSTTQNTNALLENTK